MTAALFNPNDPSERTTVARGDCVLFNGLEVPGSNVKIPWTPQPPGGRLGPAMCATLWSGWAKPVATGRGAMRNGVRQWPAKAELSGLAWCPRQALAYTTLVLTIYGRGEPIRGKGGVSQRDAKRLRAEIGRPRPSQEDIPAERQRLHTRHIGELGGFVGRGTTACDTGLRSSAVKS